jgi:pimeloyl-ACP methyl ester carboxylesterase
VSLNHLRLGSGPPLLLLHSLGGTLVQWNPVLDLLAADHEVIAVDMPGFGSSAPLPDSIEPTAANLAAAVLDFTGSLGLGAMPAVAGISLGGWVAIECARQGGASAVVGICPAGFWREPLQPRRNTAQATARLLRPLVPLLLRSRAVRRAALAGNIRNPDRVPVDDAIALVKGYGEANDYVRANHHMRAGLVGSLDDVEVPVTLAWAEFDTLVRSRPFREGVLPPAVHQVELRGCGHVPTWDDPQLVARVILDSTA